MRNGKRRGHVLSFTLAEFHARFLHDETFLKLHKAWVDNGYQSDDRPSFDRIDPDLEYTLDNIQVLTWKENSDKGRKESARLTTSINVYDLKGKLLYSFDSFKEAAQTLNLSVGNIDSVLKGKRPHTKGFTFQYRGDRFKKANQFFEKKRADTPDPVKMSTTKTALKV